jgi:SAM-dependent methyltransferase
MPRSQSQHHTTSRNLVETLRTYEKDAEIFLKQWGRKRYKRPPLLAEWLKQLPARAVLLDLGCGAGQDSRYLAGLGRRVIGLDRTMPLLRFAKQRTPSAPFLLADLRALPIRSGSLDGIWAAASVIHLHKRDVARVLAALRHLVKPRGLFAAKGYQVHSSRPYLWGFGPRTCLMIPS